MPADSHDARPSPDALLEEAKREGRGRLKVFLGAAPGVGKTYEMLSDARQRRRDGVDVVVGVVETHGRIETDALTKGFETIPKKHIPYKGRVLHEMDLDAILQRRPKLVLVDELAHTNAEGSRHPKRYLDVEELLAAGIDVYTTVNIQHLESLNDIVAQITRIRVRETVPDRIVDEADEVEVVDITPEGLTKRLSEGKVYVRAQAERALKHYFSPGNLTALRELALRKVAQRVDRQMVGYMKAHAIAGPWAAGERILVCIDHHPSSAELVRHARRIADYNRATFVAAYVESARHLQLSEVERDRVADTLRLAQRLGGETVTLPGRGIADSLLAHARETNVTQIVVGKSQQSRWFELLHGSVVRDLVRESGSIAIHVVAAQGEALPPKTVATSADGAPVPWGGYGVAGLATAATLGVAFVVDRWVDLDSLPMVFLLPVLYTAVNHGLRPALLATALSIASYNFFFIPPLYTFTVADPSNVLALVILLIVAVIASNLAARVRVQADLASTRARTAGELFGFTGKLAGIASLDDILWAAAYQMASMLKANIVVLLPDRTTRLLAVRAGYPPEDELDASDLAAATWCWNNGKAAGRNSDTLPGARRLFLPMRTGNGLMGVVGLMREESRPLLAPDERRLLDALIDQTALAVERSQLADEVEGQRVRVEADRLRAAMMTSLSHDLRTPLASVLGAATSLRAYGDTLDADRRRELLATIEEEARRLDRFVGNLLDMSRLEAGSLGIKPEVLEVDDVLDETLQRVQRQLARHRIVRNPVPATRAVLADRILLEQALVNLLDNAAKYSPEGSVIQLTAVADGERIGFVVADEGPGVPAADLPHIFDKFYRARSGDRRIAGTGLGLAIARGFVEAMGGTIAVANRTDRTGAVFTIDLPAAARTALHHVA